MAVSANGGRAGWRHGLMVGVGAFFLAALLGFSAHVFTRLPGLALAFGILLLVIMVGVTFDIVGTAATAAAEQPFHAMSAKKVRGAREAIKIVRNADRVASFCNDVVGDASGTVSGIVGAGIIAQLMARGFPAHETLSTAAIAGAIAGLTVGGKALGKGFAIREANGVVLRAARALLWLEKVLGVQVLASGKGRRKRGRTGGANTGQNR